MARRLALPVFVAAALVASSCDGGAATREPSGDLFFPTQEPTKGPRVTMQALTYGTLVVEKGCLLLSHEDGSTDLPVWPPGFELSTEGGEIRVLDETGRVVARVGDQVSMGGGQVGVNERLRRRLNMPEECPGPIWWVGEEVRAIHRG